MQAIREYKQFVREQPDKTKTLEEMMRMGALMLPTSSLGDNAEVATEMMYSALGFMGFYHGKGIMVMDHFWAICICLWTNNKLSMHAMHAVHV